MPGTTGIELQEQLNKEGHSFPIIFITAFPEDSVKNKAMASGAFSFLSKPFNSEVIINCIESALNRREI
jgi:FixJ family two-component response regulator